MNCILIDKQHKFYTVLIFINYKTIMPRNIDLCMTTMEDNGEYEGPCIPDYNYMCLVFFFMNSTV